MRKSQVYPAIIAVIIDAIALFGAFVLAYQLKTDGTELYNFPFGQFVSQIIVLIPVWIFLFALQGLYNIRNLPFGFNSVGKLSLSLVSSWGLTLIYLYMARTPESQSLSRLLIVYAIIWSFVFTLAGKLILSLVRMIMVSVTGGIRTAIIAEMDSDFIGQVKLTAHDRELVGVVNTHNPAELEALYAKSRFEELIYANMRSNEENILKAMNWADNRNISFALVPGIFMLKATNYEIGILGGKNIMFFKRTPLDGWGRILKRAVDVICSIILIILFSPFWIMTGILVWITSRGPMIYRQERIGQDGMKFYIHKFRSMYVDGNERFGNDWSADEKTDPRVTLVGRLIRATNLDELPQLFDVLAGTMSLVGPRPEQPKYVDKFAKSIPDYLRRHHVKTGLTGWAQINGLRGDTSIEDRVKYDIYYIEHWSLWFDFRIMLGTLTYMIKNLFR